MSRSYDREDFFGNKYTEDEEGNRTYEREDFFGNKYHEDEDGSRTYEKEDFFGNKYREDDSGSREYEREDFFGNRYREDENGEKTYYREDFFGNTYEEKEEKNEGGCFLTTACVRYAGLPDDCDELATLRVFRDRYVRFLPNGPELISEYYRVAPQIVSALARHADSSQHLNWILGQVREAVRYIRGGQFRSALEVYTQMFERMRTIAQSLDIHK